MADASGAAEPAVLVMGVKRGRWYTLTTPSAAYAAHFAALRARLRAPPPTRDDDGDEKLPALRPPPSKHAAAAADRKSVG